MNARIPCLGVSCGWYIRAKVHWWNEVCSHLAGQKFFLSSCFRSGLKGRELCREELIAYLCLDSPCSLLPLTKGYAL